MYRIVAIIGPTASGKSVKAIELALERGGEVISVDSRQVYRTLDIGTEKLSSKEMRNVPHYLIDIREPEESYSAGEFLNDATRLIEEISSRGKLPILAGGTHFYFDALLNGIPQSGTPNPQLRAELQKLSVEELFARLQALDPRRAERIDAQNPRRLVRALELIGEFGMVPERPENESRYDVEWVVIDPPREELRTRIDSRLKNAFERGLMDEVSIVRERVGDARLNEFGLEYRVVGECLREEREEASLLPVLSAKLWHFAKHQKSWLKRLAKGDSITS
ncbi:MAG: tRNA dimethylallyltransferase [Candidatus Parcubacteria bacterium]|jgi:tRNA dimethylallyltransferase|nr:tRNA dimethylallyltransferase [Candidatus Parcubacteria bacterium]